jgi:translation initiation factor IF-3
MYELKGTLKVIKPTEVVSDKFKKREFVVSENSSQYPQVISFQCAQDKCSLLDNLTEGQDVKVSFNLRGREWTGKDNVVKYFNTLDVWKIEAIGATSNQAAAPAQAAAQMPEVDSFSDDDGDLPF